MLHTWPLQDAKARFSEVVKRAATEGPQMVTCRGVETAVVVSVADYRRWQAERPSLVDYLLSGPEFDDETADAVNARSREPGRDIDL
jgi:prevent-host-death family protein